MRVQLANSELVRLSPSKRQTWPTHPGIKMICSMSFSNNTELTKGLKSYIGEPIRVPKTWSPTRALWVPSKVQAWRIRKIVLEPETHRERNGCSKVGTLGELGSILQSTVPSGCERVCRVSDTRQRSIREQGVDIMRWTYWCDSNVLEQANSLLTRHNLFGTDQSVSPKSCARSNNIDVPTSSIVDVRPRSTWAQRRNPRRYTIGMRWETFQRNEETITHHDAIYVAPVVPPTILEYLRSRTVLMSSAETRSMVWRTEMWNKGSNNANFMLCCWCWGVLRGTYSSYLYSKPKVERIVALWLKELETWIFRWLTG